MALDDPTKKMSKSDENVNSRITLLDDADTIRRKFKRAVTDSGADVRFDETRPAITNLLSIYQLLTGKSAQQTEDHFANKGYAQLKSELADVTIEFLTPFQECVRSFSDENSPASSKQVVSARMQSPARPSGRKDVWGWRGLTCDAGTQDTDNRGAEQPLESAPAKIAGAPAGAATAATAPAINVAGARPEIPPAVMAKNEACAREFAGRSTCCST